MVPIATFHTSIASGHDILHKFWEVEESPKNATSLSLEEHTSFRFPPLSYYKKEDQGCIRISSEEGGG